MTRVTHPDMDAAEDGFLLHGFNIVYFDELDDVSQLSSLYHLSLNWPVTPELFRMKRKRDDRYAPEFGLFAVANDDTVMGGVFLMRIPTRTVNDKLMVGGVNAVATRPGYQRRGVMTALMARCHKYFAEHQLDYSFLTTSRSLGAHSMYQKLGYEDLLAREVAWKQVGRPGVPNKKFSVRNFRNKDKMDVARVFREATRDSYGFIYRQADFLNARINGPFLRPSPTKNMRIVKRNEKVSGYAYWESSPQFSICEEILTSDKSSFTSLLADAEERFPSRTLIVRCSGLSKREINWLQSAHYIIRVQTYGTVMIKPIREHANLESMKALFGVDKGLFRMGTWDST